MIDRRKPSPSSDQGDNSRPDGSDGSKSDSPLGNTRTEETDVVPAIPVKDDD